MSVVVSTTSVVVAGVVSGTTVVLMMMLVVVVSSGLSGLSKKEISVGLLTSILRDNTDKGSLPNVKLSS